ncbi:MAG: hypothetical protein ABI305_12230 [Tepidiformaceae bacterium]
MVRRLSNVLRHTALSASVLCASVVIAVPVLSACGGDSGVAKTIQNTTPGANGTAGASADATPNDAKSAPTLTMPVSRFAVGLDDLGNAFITNVDETYVLNVKSYAASMAFTSPAEGEKLLTEWGYKGGYETGFRPEGGDTAVLNGAYNVNIETDLFASEDGAKKAYDYFDSRLKTSGQQPVEVAQVGNQSEGWKFAGGKIKDSSESAADHRFMFRRGNLVVIVRTLGADAFMTIGQAHDIAWLVDQKALGKAKAIEPTPTSNFTPSSGAGVPTVTR